MKKAFVGAVAVVICVGCIFAWGSFLKEPPITTTMRSEPDAKKKQPVSFWDQKVPPCSEPPPVAAKLILSDDATSTNGDPIARAFNTLLPSSERNEAMEAMAQRGTKADIDGLLLVLTTVKENEIIASWGAQHLGLIWSAMAPDDIARVREALIKTLDVETPLFLPRREASLALAQLNDAKANEAVSAYVEKHVYADMDSELDNVVRIIGLMRLSKFASRVDELTAHPVVQVSGAAKEARALCAAQ